MPLRRLAFEGGRTDLAERRMATLLVIEHFDVVEQRPLRRAVAVEVLAELALHGREKALHHGIIPAVATPAHAARDAVGLEYVLIIVAGVRASLVRMMEQPDRRTSPLQRHLERLDREVSVVHRADRPADDEPREQIQDGREVNLLAAGLPLLDINNKTIPDHSCEVYLLPFQNNEEPQQELLPPKYRA